MTTKASHIKNSPCHFAAFFARLSEERLAEGQYKLSSMAADYAILYEAEYQENQFYELGVTV